MNPVSQKQSPLLLEMLNCPSDLKLLKLEDLERLAEEIRQRILNVLSVNGGHLSSNLGIVELTIALHKVFNSPQDKFIFDTSHQSYPHKLLTGRNELFPRLRQYKGLCGFCHPKESKHDAFFAGHAGTALSLALGTAKARDLSKRPDYVLPILGDASLTCGLTLEALNNIPKDLSRFMVVLNDNARSISENVGHIKDVLLKDPASFFAPFGLSYIGPIDGHNLEQVIATFEELKNREGPFLVHVMTVKGKGMPMAIANPTPYHGVGPFDLCSGKFLPNPSSKPTFPKIFGRHLLKMAEHDENLVALTPATPAGSCLDAFMKRFPERCLDVGIAEGHAVTFGGGIAADKTKKVVICIYATFFQRAFDNLFQDVCMQDVPVVFALDRSFLSGPDGSTHHGIFDIAFLNAMPRLVLTQARNGHLLKELLESSFSWGKPAAIRYPNLETEEPDLPMQKRPLGRGEILIQGEGLLLISLGHQYATAFRVRELLLTHGIEATIVDPVFIKPLDEELFNTLLLTHPFVATIEEHAVNAGLGMIFNSFLVQNKWKETEVLNFGIPDRFMEFGSHKELLKEVGLDPETIASKILMEFYADRAFSQRKEKSLV